MVRTKNLGALACAVVLVVGLSGCGSDSSSGGASPKKSGIADLAAKDIARKSVDTMHALDAFHVKGQAADDGSLISMDLSIDGDGNCSGSVALGAGGRIEILVNHGTTLIKGDEAFWDSAADSKGAQMLKVIDGRWTKLPTKSGVGDVCSIDKFLKGFDTDKLRGADLTKGAVGEVDGQPALDIASKEDDGTYHIWVATKGKPYILRIDLPEGQEGTGLAFSDFDKPLSLE